MSVFGVCCVKILCCVGVGRCGMCWGHCCPLVNDVLSALIEVGELAEDAKVSVRLCDCCVCVVVEPTFGCWGLYYQVGKLENYHRYGWKPAIFDVVS